jgi:anti-repressor protein
VDKLAQVFQYNGAQVRTVVRDGQPFFSIKDVCDILDIGNVTDATKRLEKDEFDLIEDTDTLGRRTGLLYVTESGLYALVLGSRKPEAREFKRWVTHEVLPQIRQTGAYSLDRLPTHLETAKALVAALEKQSLLEAKIEADAPKVKFFEDVGDAAGLHSMNEAAKLLGWGPNNLFAHLRKMNILLEKPHNAPRQCFIDRGYFVVKERTYTDSSGQHIHCTPFVTPEGLQWLHDKLPPYKANKKSHRSGKDKPEGHWPTAIAGARS